MNLKTNELIIYNTIGYENIFRKIVKVMESADQDVSSPLCIKEDFYKSVYELVEIGVKHGFEGNLWHNYLTYLLVNNENAFSTSSEIMGEIDGSINMLALHDFKILKQLYQYDFHIIGEKLELKEVTCLLQYAPANQTSKVFNRRIRDRIGELSHKLYEAADAKEMMSLMTKFYGEFGVGTFGLHKGFRVKREGGDVNILPITNIEHIYLKDLVGYELQKKKLIDNTEAFVEGRKANNVLLFGDSGTGKSSSIKAILNEYYDKGLRMIEIYKHQFQELSAVIEQVKDRNYKFIIYMDDLSFEDFEIEYKYLKAVIEGGLEKRPDNVLIYATSNRRHLVREKWSDKEDRREDLHASDTVQEKLSLVARFGVSIFYIAPDKKEYMNIVNVLADKYHIQLPKEELFAEANKWELSHGGLSGRTAQQFVNYLIGQKRD